MAKSLYIDPRIVKALDFLRMTRRECERDRIEFQENFFHVLPAAVVTNVLLPSLATLSYKETAFKEDKRLEEPVSTYNNSRPVITGGSIIGSTSVISDMSFIRPARCRVCF